MDQAEDENDAAVTWLYLMYGKNHRPICFGDGAGALPSELVGSERLRNIMADPLDDPAQVIVREIVEGALEQLVGYGGPCCSCCRGN